MLYHIAECRYAEYHVLFIIMLNVIMLSVVMLSIVAPKNSQFLQIYKFVPIGKNCMRKCQRYHLYLPWPSDTNRNDPIYAALP